jgi:hypothetical protein
LGEKETRFLMDSSARQPEAAVVPVGVLLDGEDPTSVHRDDPEHWVAVYSELIESTNRILVAARERLASPAAAEQAEAKLLHSDIAALVARSEFFAARLRWWANRGRELWSED